MASGGVIIRGRLSGALALTRAFGDFDLQNEGLLCEPYVRTIEVTEPGTAVIMASDGLWDTLSDEEVGNILKENLNIKKTTEIIQELIALSIRKGSRDNITVMIIRL